MVAVVPVVVRRVVGALVVFVAVLAAATATAALVLCLRLGTGGEAHFVGTTRDPGVVVLPPSVVQTLDAPVEVSARRDDGGPVWMGVGRSGDVNALLRGARRTEAYGLRYPAQQITWAETRVGVPRAAATADIWRASARSSGPVRLVVEQGHGAESVVVASGDTASPSKVTTTLTWHRRTWFLEALVAAMVGLFVCAVALLFLWQRRSWLWVAPSPAKGSSS